MRRVTAASTPAATGNGDDPGPGDRGPGDREPGDPALWPTDSGDSSLRLMEAAIDAFAERGFHATTTRDIAQRVGLSPAALYVHFPSKGALLARISRLGHEQALRLVDDAVASRPDPLSGLQEVVRRFASWHAEHHRVARVVHNELAALPDDDRRAVLELRRRIEARVQDLLRAGTAEGTMLVENPAALARAVLSLGVDVVRWYDPAGHDTPDDIGILYADLATRMVGARS